MFWLASSVHWGPTGAAPFAATNQKRLNPDGRRNHPDVQIATHDRLHRIEHRQTGSSARREQTLRPEIDGPTNHTHSRAQPCRGVAFEPLSSLPCAATSDFRLQATSARGLEIPSDQLRVFDDGPVDISLRKPFIVGTSCIATRDA